MQSKMKEIIKMVIYYIYQFTLMAQPPLNLSTK
jgi:hypothetical protein